MNIQQLATTKLQTVTFTFNFVPKPDIENYDRDFERFFGDIFSNQRTKLTKVPHDSPMDIPRFVIKDRKRVLEVSLTSIKFIIQDFGSLNDTAISNYMTLLNKVIKAVSNFDWIEVDQYQSLFLLQYPHKEKSEEIQKDIFSLVTQNNAPEKLAACHFQYEERLPNYTKLVKISDYSTRQITVKNPPSNNTGSLKVHTDQMTLIETGISLLWNIVSIDMTIENAVKETLLKDILKVTKEGLEENEQFNFSI